jgi:hypothetical protein
MADRNVVVVNCNGSKPILKRYTKTASTAFDKNSLVEFASGVINPSDDNDIQVFGIILEEVATTDSDYDTTASKLVQLLRPTDEVEINWSGTVPSVGKAYGISSAYNVDQTDETNKVFTATKVVTNNTTSGRVRGVFKTYFGDNNL